MPASAVSAAAELAALRLGVTTRHLAASVGLSPRDVRRALEQGYLCEPIPGVLSFPDRTPHHWHHRLSTVTAAGGDHAVVSHRAAARIHRFDGFTEAPIEVTTQRPRRLMLPRDFADVVTHQACSLEPVDIVEMMGLRVTSVARTMADIGSVVGRDAVWRALIGVQRANVSPRWLYQTAVRLHRPGQAGTGRLLGALRRWQQEGVMPDSWMEELLHRIVADESLGPVVRQCPITDQCGRVIARADIGFPEVRLGLEGHSREFHFGPDAGALDEDRDLRCAQQGCELLYLGWYATRRPADVHAIVRDVVQARAASSRSAISQDRRVL